MMVLLASFRLHISFGQVMFLVQLIIAEAMFLYSYRKRNLFILRLIVAIAVCLVFTFLTYDLFNFSNPGDDITSIVVQQTISFIYILLQITVTVFCAYFCFKERLWTLISACMAGYATQHFTFNAERLFELAVPLRQLLTRIWYYVAVMAIFLFIYAIFFFCFAYLAAKNSYKNNGDKRLNILAFAVIVTLVIINRFLNVAGEGTVMQSAVNRLFGMAFCLLSLIIQFSLYKRIGLYVETVTVKELLKQGARQYEQWKASVEDINIMYHDLRHDVEFIKQVGKGRLVEEAEHTLDEYGNFVHTGNESLDMLIVGKRLVCRKHGMRIMCVVEEGVLNCFDGYDMYSLFSNAIDNAIEGLEDVEEENFKVISIVARRKGNAAAIEVENYYNGKLDAAEGLPASCKKESWHGYGLKSMRNIVEKYGGVMVVNAKNKKFSVGFLLPFPANTNGRKC